MPPPPQQQQQPQIPPSATITTTTTTTINKQEEEASSSIQFKPTVGGRILRQLFQITFYAQLFIVFILVLYLTIHAWLSVFKTYHFQPKKWYLPVLASTACAGIASFSLQCICSRNPGRALRAMFWVAPLMAAAVGILLLLIGSAVGLLLGIFAVISAVILSLYACWVHHRFQYAVKILKVSIGFPHARTAMFTFLSIVASVLYSALLVTGIGGASASANVLDVVFILIILMSLSWSMQVIKNVLFITISRIRYLNFASGDEMEVGVALRDTIKHLVPSVCIGSALVPVLGMIRGSARSMNLVTGDADEFMFMCSHCYTGAASTLIAYGNRWGFVHVGVYNKGFVQASFDVWDMFKRAGLISLIDSDLTGAFCFLCGVAVGSMCSLIAGTWALVIHKSYAAEVSVCTFFIGYFTARIAMAWQQASVAAYYVAYAENPLSQRYDSTVPDRIQELRRYQA